MVCIYCQGATAVINSRSQRRQNQVWRRRRCLECQAIFTTIEATDASLALQVRRKMQLAPFSRDTLMLSIYASLRHRSTAAQDATALTATSVATLYRNAQAAVIDRDNIVRVVSLVLVRFDSAAATYYQAYHPV